MRRSDWGQRQTRHTIAANELQATTISHTAVRVIQTNKALPLRSGAVSVLVYQLRVMFSQQLLLQ
jgi:hypothetical protein